MSVCQRASVSLEKNSVVFLGTKLSSAFHLTTRVSTASY